MAMDNGTARRLCDLTREFYRRYSGSFSRTRQSAWPGWLVCVDVLREAGLFGVASGNGMLVDSSHAGAAQPDAARPDSVPLFAGQPDASRPDAALSFAARRPGAAPPVSSRLDTPAAPRPDDASFSVLDLACGNMRFETFLSGVFAGKPAFPPLRFFAVDNCDDLAKASAADSGCAGGRENVRYQSLDIMAALFSGERLGNLLDAPPCDLSVAFGFMHHVPLPAQRAAVLDALVEATCPGGFIVVSFWRFLHDEKYAAKARAEHKRAAAALGLPPLDEGDCVLGWNDVPGAFRYCHSFSEGEIDALAAHVAPHAAEVARFNSDGRTGEMNAYLVLRRKHPSTHVLGG